MQAWLEGGVKSDQEWMIERSKSTTNRYLILAAQSSEPRIILNPSFAEDSLYLMKALKMIGCRVSSLENAWTVKGPFPECEKKTQDLIKVEGGEGATTVRFLAALLSLGKNRYEIKCEGKLAIRPWDELIQPLQNVGVDIEFKEGSLFVQGPWRNKPEEILVDSSRSSQFVSALALLTPTLKIKVTPIHLTASKSYWELTQKCLHDFDKNQNFHVPVDWSSAAPLLALSCVLGQKKIFAGLRPDQLQGDSIIGEWLGERGALNDHENGMQTYPLTDKTPLEINVENCLDLFPTWCFMAAHLDGVSKITGLTNLRYKESDRVQSVISLLIQMGVKTELKENIIHIIGKSDFSGARELFPEPDHRIVMMGACFLAAHDGGVIHHAEAVKKSFPRFFEYFNIDYK